MKFLRHTLALLLAGLPSLLLIGHIYAEPPQLTVVIVIDQFAYSHIRKLAPNLKFGLKHLLKNGINFTDAHHPHGATCTGTGHAALGTGTFAKDHGIVLNDWLDEHGKEQGFHDEDPEARQFYGLDQNRTCSYGISAKNLMVDGLSDQLILSSTPEIKNRVYSISLKPRASIGMGGRLGRSIWFDHNIIAFTSSKAFFKKLPTWLVNFNKKHDLTKIKKVHWKSAYPRSSSAYNFENINEYDYTSSKAPRADKVTSTECKRSDGKKVKKNKEVKIKTPFTKFPQANKLLLNLATDCLQAKFQPHRHEPGKFLLWVSLSPLDMIGHAYGPECFETIDMIYHLDKQLMGFIKQVQRMAGKQKVLFVLSADHGVSPIPELMNRKGPTVAHRILQKDMVAQLNQAIKEQFDIDNVVSQAKVNQFYLNKKIFASLDENTKTAILDKLKATIKQHPGIHEVWTSDELNKANFKSNQLESYFKNQYYPGRSGDLICMTKPHTFFSKHSYGTSHCSPYKDTTQVPIIMYQAGRLQKKTIDSRVWTQQVPVTIAKILGVQPPSASPFQELPGILPKP